MQILLSKLIKELEKALHECGDRGVSFWDCNTDQETFYQGWIFIEGHYEIFHTSSLNEN